MTDRERNTSDDPRDPRHEPAGSHAGTGAPVGEADAGMPSATGSDRSAGPDAERNEMGRDAGGGGQWHGDPGLDADEGLIGRGGTGSLGSGGVATPQSDPDETSWQDEAAGAGATDAGAPDPGMTGGAQGQAGVEGEGWEGRARDTGTGSWTTGDAGFGSSTADDGGPQSDDPAADPSNARSDLS